MRNSIIYFCLAVAALPGLAAAQAPAKGDLAQQIKDAYPVTVMDGMKVTKPGTLLVVKKEGLQANPMGSKLGPFDNEYEDGQVTTGARGTAIGQAKDGAGSHLPGVPGGAIGGLLGKKINKKAKMEARALAVDDKLYLLNVDVKPDSIVFLVQSCGTCDPGGADPSHNPAQATVAMHFVKGYLTATDVKHVQQAINTVLAVPEENAGADQNAQAQPQQQGTPAADGAQAAATAPAAAPAEPAQHFDTIAPPAPPAADPVQINLGQSVDQVTTALGKPDKVLKAGGKEIYVYKDLKVTFVKGKVTDVE